MRQRDFVSGAESTLEMDAVFAADSVTIWGDAPGEDTGSNV